MPATKKDTREQLRRRSPDKLPAAHAMTYKTDETFKKPEMLLEGLSLKKLCAAIAASALVLGGCTVGPKYHTPSAPTPTAYKELTPANYPTTDGWKVAQPKDDALRGKWWEMFNDPELTALEDQVNISNQNIAAAAATFLSARAMVKEARAQYFPTLTTSPAITRIQQSSSLKTFTTGSGSGSGSGGSGSGSSSSTNLPFTEYSLPFDASWQPDLWGKIRNQVRSQVYGAQASAADLENVRLTVQSEVAIDYFSLRTQDTLQELLNSTVIAYQESLKLTQALYETGIDSDEAVAQAETQLESTQAQATGVGLTRAQFEHAIATLIGKPASEFSIPVEPFNAKPVAIPYGIPSQLLERRPDVAANERLMAQANAQIGVATAAYYPTVTLSAVLGLQSISAATWFTAPSRFWSVGPTLAETLFDAGLRHATVQQFRGQYDLTVANYRQAVLTGFQQVEDDLAALRILSQEIQQQDTAVQSAERNLKVATDRYRLGIDPYLNVITAQTLLLSNKETLVNLKNSQITSSVQLVEALGGGWDKSQLPSGSQLIAKLP
jgi:NodT family efflux transporter outer membrane factor (OMF) lipoprotein